MRLEVAKALEVLGLLHVKLCQAFRLGGGVHEQKVMVVTLGPLGCGQTLGKPRRQKLKTWQACGCVEEQTSQGQVLGQSFLRWGNARGS